MSNQLSVISKSKKLVNMVYKLCNELPRREEYIIIPQILRSAISVPSNIAEGSEKSKKDFIRYIRIARGSLRELDV